MKNKNGYWRTLLLALLLAGCATQPRPGPGEGLLVVSVTQETATPTHAFSGEDTQTGRVHTASFRLTGPAAQSRWLTASGRGGTRIPPEAGKPLGNGGRLYVVSLPAGEYRVDDWKLSYIDDWTLPRKVLAFGPVASLPPLPFSIQAGETLYIGNLHMEISMGGALIDMHMVASSQAQVLDSQARDLALLTELQPAGAMDTAVRLLPLGDWAVARAPEATAP